MSDDAYRRLADAVGAIGTALSCVNFHDLEAEGGDNYVAVKDVSRAYTRLTVALWGPEGVAPLIDAAPDLLAIAKKIQWARAALEAAEFDRGSLFIREVCDDADAAIAKATGAIPLERS